MDGNEVVGRCISILISNAHFVQIFVFDRESAVQVKTEFLQLTIHYRFLKEQLLAIALVLRNLLFLLRTKMPIVVLIIDTKNLKFNMNMI